jgi:lipooligosaccharide transport system permease protein
MGRRNIYAQVDGLMAVAERIRGPETRSLLRAANVFTRNRLAYRHAWAVFVSGFFEPLFYLGAVGFGLGRFINQVPFGGHLISYAAFVAPGMLAASTLNGAIADGFFNPFFKLNWMRIYDAMVSTPLGVGDIVLGEIIWAQMRGTLYSAGFLIVMLILGLIESAWAVLALPAAMLCSTALSAGAMVLTGITKQISSLEKVMTLIVFPLFLFSGTFFPIGVYPAWLRPLVEAMPLYRSAHLLRSLTTGSIDIMIVVDVLYLIGMAALCWWVAVRLIRRRMVA